MEAALKVASAWLLVAPPALESQVSLMNAANFDVCNRIYFKNKHGLFGTLRAVWHEPDELAIFLLMNHSSQIRNGS